MNSDMIQMLRLELLVGTIKVYLENLPPTDEEEKKKAEEVRDLAVGQLRVLRALAILEERFIVGEQEQDENKDANRG